MDMSRQTSVGGSRAGVSMSKRSSIAVFGTRARFVVMIVVLLCLTSIWANILTFNITAICMAPNENSTAPQTDTHEYTHAEESWITSVVAIAALVATIPVTLIINRAGIRTIFALTGLINSIATILIPVAVRGGFGWLLLCRFLQGLGFAALYPVIGSFCSKWAYHKQTGLFVSLLVAYVQLAPAITMSVSGPICKYWGWPTVFYMHGGIGSAVFLLYFFFYRNSPFKHPFVGDNEVDKIAKEKAVLDDKFSKKTAQAIPYGPILRTPAIWAVWASAVGNFAAVNLLFLYSPVFLSKVLGMNETETGLTAALPAILEFLVKFGCGALTFVSQILMIYSGSVSDRLKFLSETVKFRLFNSVAFLGSAGAFIVLAFITPEQKNLNMIILTLAAGLLGASTGGFFKAGPVLSKQYSHFVTGAISVVNTLTLLIVPFLVNALTPQNTHEQWRWVFLIIAAVQISTAVFFFFFIKGHPCQWTSEVWLRINYFKNAATLEYQSSVDEDTDDVETKTTVSFDAILEKY